MSGQIFQPNFTSRGHDGGLQSSWQYFPDACHRPAADFGVPIICTTGAPLYGPVLNYTTESDIWPEFEAFSECCPTENTRMVTKRSIYNIYSSSRYCQSSVCYTSEESVAKAWGECVARQGEVVLAKFEKDGRVNKTEAADYKAVGRCEYIDYAILKKGLQSGADRVQNQKSLSIKMMVGLAVGLFVAGGGMF